jgi:hypothetical protein
MGIMEERLKILKTMNKASGKIDLNTFSAMVDMSRARTLGFLQGLVKMGLIGKVDRGYCITPQGKIASKELTSIPQDKWFLFNNAEGKYTGYAAKNLKEFIEILGKVDAKSLEFHVFRRDFEKWIISIFNDTELAIVFAKARESRLIGENLREELQSATADRYSKFEKLLAS